MADLKERNIALVSKDSDGVTTIEYPLTSAEMVEGLEEFVKTHSTSLTLPLPITKGGTGATNATGALSNLGILGAIVNVSVSGNTITFTKKDNTKVSINTQDTNNGIVAALLEQNGYAKFANGLILQWGYNNTNNNHFAFLLPYTVVPLVFAMGVGKGISLRDGYGRNADNITKTGFTTVSSPTDAYPIGWLSLGF